MENREVSGSQTISYRNYRRARDRALVRLSHDYPNLYRQYLEEEKAYDEDEGTKWVKSTGRSTFTVGVRTRTSTSGSKSPKRSNNKRAKGKRK
jgi:hypothetical protein